MRNEIGRVGTQENWETQMVHVIRVNEDGRKVGDIYVVNEEGRAVKQMVIQENYEYYWKIVEI